jgi:hypothetical protein
MTAPAAAARPCVEAVVRTLRPYFLLTFGDASQPPVRAVIIEATSMFQAHMTAVVRRLAPGVPFTCQIFGLSIGMTEQIPSVKTPQKASSGRRVYYSLGSKFCQFCELRAPTLHRTVSSVSVRNGGGI